MPDPATHAAHDPLLVSAYAAGDATGRELDAAAALVATCGECATLHRDLRTIAAALPALPPPVRPRDFRITPGMAATLHRSGWRRVLAPLAGPRFAFAAPLGATMATLGLAGILIAGGAALPLGFAGGASSAAAPMTVEQAPADGAGAGTQDTMSNLAAPGATSGPAAATTIPLPAAGAQGDATGSPRVAAGPEVKASPSPVDGVDAAGGEAALSPAAPSEVPGSAAPGATGAPTATPGVAYAPAPITSVSPDMSAAQPTAPVAPDGAPVALAGLACVGGLLLLAVRVLARRVAGS